MPDNRMTIRFTEQYLTGIDAFIAKYQTKLSLKPLIREINNGLREIAPPLEYTLGVLFVDTNFEQPSLRSIACLYMRHPEKDNEIAPCLLYFPYDMAELSVSRQKIMERIAAVKNELGWD